MITLLIVESEKRAKSGKIGRGNLFTFLSPTTVTNIIQTICKLLLLKISEEVNSAGIFSITIDTTWIYLPMINVYLSCGILVTELKAPGL